MKKYFLYFDKKYKCVSFIVHYKSLTLSKALCLILVHVSCRVRLTVNV